MASPRLLFFVALLFCAALRPSAQAQTAPPDFNLPAVNANGMLLAENSSAIERARLYRDSTPPTQLAVDSNGNALPTDSSTSDDDSFGAQQILKSQQLPKRWIVSGGVALAYTDNVALTQRAIVSDGFVVVDAAISHVSALGREVELNVGLHLGLFRYFKTSELDFQSLGFGIGVNWSPAALPGVGFFARYDFTELLSPWMDQILMDHTLSLGVQKTFSFGRAHGLTLGLFASAGFFSDPASAQRSQLGGFLSYRLQLARKLSSEILLRPAAHFYTDSNRVDFNQIASLNLVYRLSNRADLTAYLSYGLNRSDHATFDYNALTTGGGIALTIRF